MTTEEDFHRALDAKPDDHAARIAFGEWLLARGDPRGEGYRAMGRLRLWPYRIDTRSWWTAVGDGPPPHNHLPPDWFEKLAGHKHGVGGWRWPEDFEPNRENRREVDDAAALAFSKLSAQRQTELLAQGTPIPKPKKRKRSRGGGA